MHVTSTLPERKRLLWLFLLALTVRAGSIIFFHVYPGFPIEYQHDREAEHFARSIVQDGGFTNPYLPEASLPSAIRAPLHPLLLALLLALSNETDCLYYGLVYSVFAIISSLTVVAVYLVAAKLPVAKFGRSVGVGGTDGISADSGD